MCLPIKCLKAWVTISAIMTMLLGIATIIFGAIILGKDDIFIKDLKNPKKVTSYLLLIFGIFLIKKIGILLFIFGIMGCYGALKKSKCCLGFFNIMNLIFFIVFLAIGIAGLVVFNKYFINVSDTLECKKQSFLVDADNYAEKARKYFCSDACRCGADKNKVPGQIYSGLKTETGGPIRTQDCPGFQNNFQQYHDLFVAMGVLENDFKCAGICQQQNIYLFSNINRGEPTVSCGKKLIDFIKSYSRKVGSISLVVAGLLFLNLLFSCCLCCHPEKDEDEEDYYYKV